MHITPGDGGDWKKKTRVKTKGPATPPPTHSNNLGELPLRHALRHDVTATAAPATAGALSLRAGRGPELQQAVDVVLDVACGTTTLRSD